MIKEYHLEDSTPVSVNLATICFVQPVDTHTRITFIGGATLVVTESYEEVSGAKPPERTVGFGATT